MLDDYFTAPWCLRRYRTGLLASHLDGLAASLGAQGYARTTVRFVILVTAMFGRFAEARGISNARQINQRLVNRFLRGRALRGRLSGAHRAMHHMMHHLRHDSVLPAPRPARVPRGIRAPVLARYDRYLSAVRGLPASTRRDYGRGAQRLLDWLQTCHRGRRLGRLRGCDIVQFIEEHVGAYKSAAWRNRLTSQTRVFLRFLQWDRTIDADLTRVIPKLPHWRLSSLPRHLPWNQVRALIESIDTATPTGRRDRAVVLLLAVLGMRAGEVRTLRLEDLAWRTGEICLPRTKSYRERVLPLPREVGVALKDYILHGRPRTRAAEVILRHEAPIGPLLSPSAVGRIVTRSLRRTGIAATRPGAHLLRHSLATRLVNQGVPIKQIADLLGHTSINTTAIYVKVDRTRLATVALPLPGDA